MRERKPITATRTYDRLRRETESLLDMLKEEVSRHAEFAAKEPENWGTVGDMGHTRELLIEVMSFLAQRDVADIEQLLEGK